MNYNLEIQKLLLKVDQLPNPDDKINLLKQAIQIADANNDLDWGFDLRLDLISKEVDTSHCIDSFPAFAWLLNAYDTNPDIFNEDDFLWEYKWMAGAARRNANISKEQVENILEDLRQRMNRNGYTDRAYYNVAVYWHLFQGDIEKAREVLKLRTETPRDRMSHCEACELDTQVEFELMDGNFDRAIALAHDILNKKLTCGRIPFSTLCKFTYFLGKAKDERAQEFFLKAEEELAEIKNDTSFINDVSLLIHYLTQSNKEKAWDYFERHADWEIGAEDSMSFDFCSRILPLLKEKGSRKLNLSSKLDYYSNDNIYNIEELYDYYYTKANDLAKRFDARHGNTHFSNLLAEMNA